MLDPLRLGGPRGLAARQLRLRRARVSGADAGIRIKPRANWWKKF
jgi:hypothetical protein